MFSGDDVKEYARERLVRKQNQQIALDEVMSDFDQWYSRHTGKAVDWDWKDWNLRVIFTAHYLPPTGFIVNYLETPLEMREVVVDAMLRE